METNNIELTSLSQNLFNTSTPPHENDNYGLAVAELTNNNQEIIQSDQILFIDSTVADYQTLIDHLAQPTEVIILDAQRDGILQITESLQQYSDLDAIHIVSHGDVGELSLGNSKLNQNTLDNYADSLTNWADSITDSGDILLYGCNVATDLAGAEFVKDLSQYTAADILASTDLTGSENLEGDWYLEFAVGEINTDLAFKAEVNQNYQYVLNEPLIGGDIPIFDNGTVFKDFPADVTLPGSDLPSAPIRVELNKVFTPNIELNPPFLFDPSIVINSSDFRVDYVPLDLNFIDSSVDPNAPSLNFSQAENQPFSLNFANGNFSWIQFSPNYNYDRALTNSLVFPFDASSLNFNPSNFEFTSVSLSEFSPLDSDDGSITFKFDAGTFDFSSLTSRSSLTFKFDSDIFDFYDIADDNIIRFGNNFSFDAAAVTFRSDSITFDYKPRTLNFNPGAFAANANLYEYKLSAADFNAGVSVEQFNASDYRALDYAFAGDELFDSNYYTNQGGTPSGMNPFTDYIENGFRAGRNPNGLFNVNYYLDNNSDVKLNGTDPLTHYALFGGDEIFDSRDPNRLFDSSYYLANNPDVLAAGVNPLLHYIQFGWRESRVDNPDGFNPNRDPSPFFDTSYYFETYTDVLDASYKLPSANALQHYLEFGNNGTVAIESRITHPLLASGNPLAFSQVITSKSDSFAFVQNDINENNQYGVQISPGNNGEILITQTDIGNENPIIRAVEGIAYTVYALGAFVATELGEFIWEIAEGSNTLSNYSFSPGDINLTDNVFVSPGDVQAPILVESFPKNPIINYSENVFFTPLEPDVEISTPNVFPQRDEILDLILDGPFIYPDAVEIPQGFYIIDNSTGNPFPVGSSTSQGIQEVEDFVSGLSTKSTPANSKRNFFEIEQTGSLNYVVPTGRLTTKGFNETSELDGFKGRTILEAKFTDNFASSPFIPGTMKDKRIEGFIVEGVKNEFKKFALLVNDQSIPFEEVEVLVNDDRTVDFFESLLVEFNIPGRVRVVPTQVPF